MNDKVSIILPLWHPDIVQLKACIDSILRQTYSNFELIIAYMKSSEIDNNFFQLMNDYHDNRIKILECKKKGVASQMNVGIENSSGELIARMDGDDIWYPNKLDHQIAFKKNHHCNILGTWGILISNNGNELGKLEPPVTHEQIRKSLMFNDTILQSSVLMDKKMLYKIGFYDESFITAEDYELWFRIISNGFKFGNMPEYLVKYRLTPTSLSRTNWRSHRFYTIKAKNKALFRYGFRNPGDFCYYFPSLFYYFISPKNAKKIRQILKISSPYDLID